MVNYFGKQIANPKFEIEIMLPTLSMLYSYHFSFPSFYAFVKDLAVYYELAPIF